MPFRPFTTALLTIGIFFDLTPVAAADNLQIAVAANFLAPAKQIAADFEKRSGYRAVIISGSSGKLFAQISNGAPFDILLSADESTPEKLENSGLAVAGSRFTYAIGKLVLWSPQAGRVDAQGAALRDGDFRHLAVANPKLAPYGLATQQTLQALGLLERLQPRFVLGENIAQTHQFVSSGNAELGFVAQSQVVKDGKLTAGSAWFVPANLHAPIRQDAALLKRAKDKPEAAAFIAYLKSDPARSTIRHFGYDTPDQPR